MPKPQRKIFSSKPKIQSVGSPQKNNLKRRSRSRSRSSSPKKPFRKEDDSQVPKKRSRSRSKSPELTKKKFKKISFP